MDTFVSAPSTTYVDSDGRFWRNIPGLANVVYRIDARPGPNPTHTLEYATRTYNLVRLEG